MSRGNAPTLIVGGGLQGTCVALELARRGVSTVLLERDPVLMNRASLRNEGKIHLGLIYAADPSFTTASIQLQGALTFAPLLRRWTGGAFGAVAVARPFAYLVAADSLQSPDQLAAHYERVAEEFRRRTNDARFDYLGRRPRALARPMPRDEASRWFDLDRLRGVFDTEELAIDTHDLARVVRAAVAAESRITVLCAHRVREIRRGGGAVVVEGERPDGAFTLEAARVVNCAWEERLRFDAMMDVAPRPGWLHRLKYRTLVRLPKALEAAPSATMVLGAYGDVVVRPGRLTYLSWYPTGMRGWTHDLAPPDDWDAPCRGEPDSEIARDVGAKALAAIDAWFPGVAASDIAQIDAGAIVAYGRTDVDDPTSGLHDRTRIGLHGEGDYISIDPGKMTTAPLYAMDAADAVTGPTGEAPWW